MIDIKALKEQFAASRDIPNDALICYAPFSTVYFDASGNVHSCCFNRSVVLGNYHDQSLEEIWNGEQLKELRSRMLQDDLTLGCEVCELKLNGNDFHGIMSRRFDLHYQPQIEAAESFTLKEITFELSNFCNLECTMCHGYFSSAIRANREHLPKIGRPLNDDRFVESITPFLPDLEHMYFLGGEPFMVTAYLKIFDEVLRSGSEIEISITTNGSIMNKRVIDILEKVKPNIVVSIESLVPETYAAIRRNADLEKVMENITIFKDYSIKNGKFFSFSLCPIRSNFMELPSIIEWCSREDINLFFNTAVFPSFETLASLGAELFESFYQYFSNYPFKDVLHHSNNRDNLNGLLNQLKKWRNEIQEEELLYAELYQSTFNDTANSLEQALLRLLIDESKYIRNQRGNGLNNGQYNQYTSQVIELFNAHPVTEFADAYFKALLQIANVISSENLARLQEMFDELQPLLISLDHAKYILPGFFLKNSAPYLVNRYTEDVHGIVKNFIAVEHTGSGNQSMPFDKF